MSAVVTGQEEQRKQKEQRAQSSGGKVPGCLRNSRKAVWLESSERERGRGRGSLPVIMEVLPDTL